MSKELFGQAIVTSIASPATKYFAFAEPLQSGAENILVSKFIEQTLTGMSVVAPLTKPTITSISMPAATAIVDGYLTAANFTTFAAKIGGSGLANQIPFFSGTDTITGDTGLVWDNVNKIISFSKWKPFSESTTALSFYKLDGTTAVFTIDSVNNRVIATTYRAGSNTLLTGSALTMIDGSATITSLISLRNTNTTVGNYTGFRHQNANNKITAEILFQNKDHDGTTGSCEMTLKTSAGAGSLNRIVITKDGDIAFGAITPTVKHHISAGGSAAVYTKYTNTTTNETVSDGTNFGIDVNGNAIWNQLESTKTLNIQTNSVDRIVIDANGYIKIAQGLSDYASDALASAGGVPLNGLYRNGNSIQICLI